MSTIERELVDLVKKKDGRSNPNLKPCLPEEQRYIIRICLEEGMFIVGECNKGIPSTKGLESYLKRKGIDSGTFVLLSTRPRPKHVATYKFKWVRTKSDKPKKKLIRTSQDQK